MPTTYKKQALFGELSYRASDDDLVRSAIHLFEKEEFPRIVVEQEAGILFLYLGTEDGRDL